MSATARFAPPLVILACVFSAPGCAEFDLNRPIPWMTGDDDPAVPSKLVVIWKDTVLYRADASPTRGFGGRLMFYCPEGEKPVRVEGELVVYAFDEAGRSPSDTKPDRKYVFPAEQLAKRYSESRIGHSYSIWLPWDAVGGEQKEISLIARFIPVEGKPLVSQQTTSMLPGVKPPESEQAQLTSPPRGTIRGGQQVTPVSYDVTLPDQHDGSAALDPSQRRMDTYTIPVPARFGRPSPRAAVHETNSLRRTTTLRADSNATTAMGTNRTAGWSGPMLPAGPTSSPPPRSIGSPPAKSPAPNEPTARPASDRTSSRPRPAAWPYRRQSTLPPANAR